MDAENKKLHYKIKRVQNRIRRDAEKYGDEHKAWSFELDIFIEGVIFLNPDCQNTLRKMDESIPTWRVHAASEFARQMAQ